MKLTLAAIGIALLLGFAVGYKLMPAKVIEKTKIVEKVAEKRDIKIVMVEKPDGTKVTTTTDNTVTTTDVKTDKFKETTLAKPDWLLSAAYLRSLDGKTEIIGGLQRRLIGSVYVGVFGSSHGTGGVGVTVAF